MSTHSSIVTVHTTTNFILTCTLDPSILFSHNCKYARIDRQGWADFPNLKLTVRKLPGCNVSPWLINVKEHIKSLSRMLYITPLIGIWGWFDSLSSSLSSTIRGRSGFSIGIDVAPNTARFENLKFRDTMTWDKNIELRLCYWSRHSIRIIKFVLCSYVR